MMKRRTFLCGLTLGSLRWSLAAEAQQMGKFPRIGVVEATSPAAGRPILSAFRDGLRDLGYAEGQNILIEERWAEEKPERFPALIAELVRLKVDVLVVGSSTGALAAKAAKTEVPIVFAAVSDPVARGIVPSLARPGGNLTGTSLAWEDGLYGKWIGMLKDAFPKISRMAVLTGNPLRSVFRQDMTAAAQARGVELQVFPAANVVELDHALSTLAGQRPEGLVVTADPLFFTHGARLAEFARERRLPAIFFSKELAAAGGLMSYGPSISDSFRLAATFVDRILKGAKPGDLPIEQPTKFELIVNLKTAKALGLTIPPSLLLRADQVIE